jgi:hypothetical protein
MHSENVRCIVDSPFNTTRAHAPAERCRQLVACVTLSGIMPQMAYEPCGPPRIWLPRRRGTDRDSRGAMSHHEAAALDVPTLVAKYVYPGRFLMTNELFLDIR